MGGSAAFTIDTLTTAHTGSTPTAGPAVSGMGGGAAGGFGGGARPTGAGFTGTPPAGTAPGGTGTNGTPGATGTTGAAGAAGTTGTATRTGGVGGGTSANAELIALLNSTTSRWAAASIGSQSAATYVLATDKAVMAIGGFTGSDPSPTLAEFEAYVAAGDIHYFIAGGGMGGGQGGTGAGSAITAWVTAHYTATTVGGVTVYDLTKATTA